MPPPTLHPSMKLAYRYLCGMEKRGEVYPGTTDFVLGQFRPMGTPGRTLRGVVEFMDGPGAARFKDPEYRPAAVESPLRGVVNRLVAGGAVKEASADGLVRSWSLDMGGMPIGMVADRVGQRFELAEHHHHLTEPRPKDGPTEAVRSILQRFRSEGKFGDRLDIDTVARDLASRYRAGVGEPHEVARKVADLIRAQPLLQPEGGVRFNPDDPIFHPGGVAPPAAVPAVRSI